VKELVLTLAKSLADDPGQVSVALSEHGGAVELRIEAAESDKGKIIGKQGRVIKAIRALASAAADKMGKRASVEID
jgi:uncharacterized protein